MINEKVIGDLRLKQRALASHVKMVLCIGFFAAGSPRACTNDTGQGVHRSGILHINGNQWMGVLDGPEPIY